MLVGEVKLTWIVRNIHQSHAVETARSDFDDFAELSDFADSTDFACRGHLTECVPLLECVNRTSPPPESVHAAKSPATNASNRANRQNRSPHVAVVHHVHG